MPISISGLETVAALGWRAAEEDRLGGWLLRASGGFTGRANSALATGDPGVPLAAAADAVCRWYRARQLPPMISVAYPAGQPGAEPVDQFLAGQGWTVRPGAATVLTAPAAAVARRGALSCVQVDTEPDGGWLALYHYRGQPLPGIARQLLTSAPWQAFASVRDGGQVLAIGRVAVARGWAGLTAVEVDPGHRRRGLATAITTALAAVAEDNGAAQLYLQTENGNSAALALYQQAGFTVHHGYHYRIAPVEH